MDRIVFICPDILGGVNSYVRNIAAFLKKKDVDHAVFFYGENDGLTTLSEPGDIDHSTHIRFSKYSTFKSRYKELAAYIRNDDVLICNDVFELMTLSSLGLKNRVIYILHGDLEHYNAILSDYHSSIDKVFCVSTGLKDKYSRLFPTLSFVICYPLVDNFCGNIQLEDKELLTGIFVGRYEYMKGADDFTAIVKACIESGIPVKWKVYVSTHGSDSQLLANLPESVEVSFDVPNKLLLEKIAGDDILLFPSRSEGFGMTVLEAMKRGIVPIARNLPIGIPDMVTDGESGYLVDNTEQALAAIKRLTQDRQLLKTLKSNAAGFSGSFFDYQRLGDNFLANVNEVMKQQLQSGKKFHVPRERWIERVLPEPVYRFSKWMYSKF